MLGIVGQHQREREGFERSTRVKNWYGGEMIYGFWASSMVSDDTARVGRLENFQQGAGGRGLVL